MTTEPKAPIRALLFEAAHRQVAASLEAVDAQLAQAQDDQTGDTKSSAGDKFETSREMMQQELNRLGAQRRVLLEQLLQLDVAERLVPGDHASLGSVVALATGEHYLLACGIGRLKGYAPGLSYCISLDSPLGAALRGVRAEETREFRGKPLRVSRV